MGASGSNFYRNERIARVTLCYRNGGDEEIVAPLFKEEGPPGNGTSFRRSSRARSLSSDSTPEGRRGGCLRELPERSRSSCARGSPRRESVRSELAVTLKGDTDGASLAGATIVAFDGDAAVSRAETDAQGTFALESLDSRGSYRIDVVDQDVGEVQVGPGEFARGAGDALGLELAGAPSLEVDPAAPNCDVSGHHQASLFPPPELFTPVAAWRPAIVRSVDPMFGFSAGSAYQHQPSKDYHTQARRHRQFVAELPIGSPVPGAAEKRLFPGGSFSRSFGSPFQIAPADGSWKLQRATSHRRQADCPLHRSTSSKRTRRSMDGKKEKSSARRGARTTRGGGGAASPSA